jgi:hypothetical protein
MNASQRYFEKLKDYLKKRGPVGQTGRGVGMLKNPPRMV